MPISSVDKESSLSSSASSRSIGAGAGAGEDIGVGFRVHRSSGRWSGGDRGETGESRIRMYFSVLVRIHYFFQRRVLFYFIFESTP
jgi:hypothetical protein